tara:strand:- start:4381 stop:4779 length:399 start_codon:yes stop_codon:yes gene_type:complete
MPRTLQELRDEHEDYTMDLDNIFIVYESDEEVEFTLTATKISEHLASYFGQDVRLYVAWNTTKVNSDTGQRGIRIKDIMYDIIAQCLDQDELDRIQVLPVVNGPWFNIPEDPGFIPVPPEPPEELPDDPTVP